MDLHLHAFCNGWFSLNTPNEWIQTGLISLSWHTAYGFELNNREIASLIWLTFFVGVVLYFLDIRSTLISALRTATHPIIRITLVIYFLWILLFVLISKWIGIWHTVLTKDTVVWMLTAGFVLMGGIADAEELDYFWQQAKKVLSLVIIFEYVVNFASFSIWIEIILQPLIAFALILPFGAQGPHQEKISRLVSGLILSIILVIVVGHTARTISASVQTIIPEIFILRAVWPMLLGLWVLALVFLLAVIAAYEQAFQPLERYRDHPEGLWKAKLGLMLALGIRLKWIHEASKGGTKHVANAESVIDAYETAKRYKTEIVDSER